MVNYTSNTYQMKREILTFSNKISRNLPKPERKFIADMNYGILASGSCLLTDIVDQLHEPSKKINCVDRLSRHLAKGTPQAALTAYLSLVKKWCPSRQYFFRNPFLQRKGTVKLPLFYKGKMHEACYRN